ncbi:MAG: hypothetical protein Q9218_008081, partial [Villophora microphyllina]
RHHHPWLVLASEWPSDTVQMGHPRDAQVYEFAEKRAKLNDEVKGVLPGDKNRTTVARLCDYGPKAAEQSSQPILKQFGKDFEFDLDVSDGATAGSEWGPGLAWIMEWYEEPNTLEEVCFDQEGHEYMRYDPVTKIYSNRHHGKLHEESEFVEQHCCSYGKITYANGVLTKEPDVSWKEFVFGAGIWKQICFGINPRKNLLLTMFIKPIVRQRSWILRDQRAVYFILVAFVFEIFLISVLAVDDTVTFCHKLGWDNLSTTSLSLLLWSVFMTPSLDGQDSVRSTGLTGLFSGRENEFSATMDAAANGGTCPINPKCTLTTADPYSRFEVNKLSIRSLDGGVETYMPVSQTFPNLSSKPLDTMPLYDRHDTHLAYFPAAADYESGHHPSNIGSYNSPGSYLVAYTLLNPQQQLLKRRNDAEVGTTESRGGDPQINSHNGLPSQANTDYKPRSFLQGYNPSTLDYSTDVPSNSNLYSVYMGRQSGLALDLTTKPGNDSESTAVPRSLGHNFIDSFDLGYLRATPFSHFFSEAKQQARSHSKEAACSRLIVQSKYVDMS